VELVKVPAPASQFAARPAQVYLPPAWFRVPRPTLPVIELLHGTPGTPEDWTRAGRADVTADRWAAAHDGVAPIIVMPDPNGSFTADTECVDGRRGKAETFLSVDVPNWVISTFGAATNPRSWAIAGSSEGGFCALDIALHDPSRFGTFLDFSGLDRPTYPGGATRLLGSNQAVLEHTAEWYLLHRHTPPSEAGWFEVGSADGDNTRSARRVAALATGKGIETHVVVIPNGTHSWHLWVRAFADAFPWTAYRLGLTPTVQVAPWASVPHPHGLHPHGSRPTAT
jgi:S-formylglutathione hydrolase FrmB